MTDRETMTDHKTPKENQMKSAEIHKDENPMSHPQIVSREEWQSRTRPITGEGEGGHAGARCAGR